MAWMAVSIVPCAVMMTTCASGRRSRDPLEQREPVDARHADVEQDQVEGLGLGLARGRRRRP